MPQQGNEGFDHYRLVIEEEQYFFSEHQRRIAYYSGFITVLMAATFAGFVSSVRWYQYYLLCAGPIAIIIVSYIAKLGIRRIYQRFLETITVRAKLEENLGYTRKPTRKGRKSDGWSHSEPLIASRHLDSRANNAYASSREWVDAHMNKSENYHGVAVLLFNAFIGIGTIILIALAAIGSIQALSEVVEFLSD